MTQPTVTSFDQFAQLTIQEYERYLPNAFDDSMSLLQKMNKLIQFCNQVGTTSNSLITQWNTVMQWVMNDGLTTDVSNKLNTMASDGTLASLINTQILGDLSTLLTNNKSTIVSAVNENHTSIGDITSLLTLDKSNLVSAVNDNYNSIENISYVPSIAYVPKLIDVDQTGNAGIDSSAILQTAINNYNHIKIPKGHYLLGTAIQVPSYKTIEMDEGTIIEIKAGANCYAFVNSDLINGNDHITITGGKIIGNASSQSRIFGTTLQNSYYGFGILMHKVTNLHISYMRLDSINAYAIAYINCDGVHIHDIYVWQDVGNGTNQDGVSGGGSNVLIENIRGYTSDDLVTCCAYDGQMGNNSLLFPNTVDHYNITIRNIFPLDNGTNHTIQAVSLYNSSGRTLKNILIENVRGMVNANAILLSTTGSGYFKDVQIKGISAYSSTANTIRFNNLNADNIIVSDVQRNEPTVSYGLIYCQNANSVIDKLIVKDVQLSYPGSVNNTSIIYDEGVINYLMFSNIQHTNQATSNVTLLYTRNSTSTAKTRIKAQNVRLQGMSGTQNPIVLTAGTASLSLVDVYSNKGILTPDEMDTIWDYNAGIVKYYSGAWRKYDGSVVA